MGRDEYVDPDEGPIRRGDSVRVAWTTEPGEKDESGLAVVREIGENGDAYLTLDFQGKSGTHRVTIYDDLRTDDVIGMLETVSTDGGVETMRHIGNVTELHVKWSGEYER